ncbi:metallophosphoesterase [Pseudotabrizicola sediminis]|uniref:Metallophosphoesterase n=1 Tax=Pseudotabrizicola sediminis TaxID=2486418 RepID=A0ABY2KGT5_9RHOB|nr:metallophosphoesterase [Pseudotabrizicola sediminis]TGD41447.1 metallophosphoesterase [Pseudotabrizicola sediminis]
MRTYDIIPDIHGQAIKLEVALAALGWRRWALSWAHPDPDRMIVFLGDFIDRGPDSRSVLKTVRELVDSGKAKAIMGNHELNALHYHTLDPYDGHPLRSRGRKNTQQHQAFLAQFPLDDPQTRSALEWMHSLPMFLEEDGFRAVHACWDDASIGRLKDLTENGVLSEQQLILAAGRGNPDEMFTLAERIAKGPEHPLPDGYSFTDSDGTERHRVRLKWWYATARNWRDIAVSVPFIDDLPDTDLPQTVTARTYPTDAPPVFFGHFWLRDTPLLQAQNALCLDYSAGKDGPLVSYVLSDLAEPLTLENIRVHPAIS